MRYLAMLLMVSCASVPPSGAGDSAAALLDEAAAAMGGWAALDRVKSQELRSSGVDWDPLQAEHLGGESRQLNTFEQVLLVDYEKKRIRLTFDATRLYPVTSPVKFVEVIDGEVGMLAPKERLHPSRLAARLRDFNRMPARVLYTAKAAADLRRSGDVLKYTDLGAPVELFFDAATKLPARVIYTEDDPIFGDTLNELVFSDWREHDGGVRLPNTQTLLLNGEKMRVEKVQSVVNHPVFAEGSFDIPAEARAVPEDGERILSQWTLRRIVMGVPYQDYGRKQKVELFELAAGVFHVRGSSHHSLAVEMKDHLIVVEAPLFEERSLAVMKVLAEKFPGKPVRYLVITHFHFDHTGGVRAYAAKGAVLVVHEENVGFVRELLARPHMVRPDSLAKTPGASVVIEPVREMKTYSDGARLVELRAIENEHSNGMLFAYLPAEKIAFVSDLYAPPGPVALPSIIFERKRSQAFYDGVKKAGIEVELIAGGHGNVGTLTALGEKLKATE